MLFPKSVIDIFGPSGLVLSTSCDKTRPLERNSNDVDLSNSKETIILDSLVVVPVVVPWHRHLVLPVVIQTFLVVLPIDHWLLPLC
jgi:hypothetical protein